MRGYLFEKKKMSERETPSKGEVVKYKGGEWRWWISTFFFFFFGLFVWLTWDGKRENKKWFLPKQTRRDQIKKSDQRKVRVDWSERVTNLFIPLQFISHEKGKVLLSLSGRKRRKRRCRWVYYSTIGIGYLMWTNQHAAMRFFCCSWGIWAIASSALWLPLPTPFAQFPIGGDRSQLSWGRTSRAQPFRNRSKRANKEVENRKVPTVPCWMRSWWLSSRRLTCGGTKEESLWFLSRLSSDKRERGPPILPRCSRSEFLARSSRYIDK